MAKRKNLNALKHGVYSHLKFLPEESCEKFEELYRAVYEEFDPQGPVQESKADSIALNLWRKRQWERWYGGRNTKTAENKLRRIDEDIHTLNRFLDGVRGGKSAKELCLTDREHAVCSSLFPRKNYDNEKAYLEAIADYVATRAIREYKDERDDVIREHVIGPLYSNEAIAKQLPVEERLDGKIDKDAISIGRLKTMQVMIFGDRQMGPIIEHEPVKQIDLPAQIGSTQPDLPTPGEVGPSPGDSERAGPRQTEVIDSPPIAPDSAEPSTTGDSPPEHVEPATTEAIHSRSPDAPSVTEFAAAPATESDSLPSQPPIMPVVTKSEVKATTDELPKDPSTN
jgi:hypothetical protein